MKYLAIKNFQTKRPPLKIIFANGERKTPKRHRFPKFPQKNEVKILSRFGHDFHSQIFRQIPKNGGIWGKYASQNVN